MKETLEGLMTRLLEKLKNPSFSKLRDELLEYTKFFKQILEVMNDKMNGGLEHATVIRTGTHKVVIAEEPKYGDFKLESNVIINPESEFANNPMFPDNPGKIIEFDPVESEGWALVDFGRGIKQPLRYGNPKVDGGACDLILIGHKILDEREKETITVSYRAGLLEVFRTLEFDVRAGDTVLINPNNHQIVSKVDALKSGPIGLVDEVLENLLVVSSNGHKRIVEQNPDLEGRYTRGDRVRLDENNKVALSILPKSKSIAISSDIKTVEWDDVIGLEEAKKQARLILDEVVYPELYASYGSKSSGGILLIGPPGNGKTFFGKAIATELDRRFGGGNGKIEGYMYIKSSEILDMYVGEAPRKVREIFAKAEEFFKETGRPAIIFVDEIDVVIKKRGSDRSNGSSDQITTAFLTEMGGIQSSYAFVIGATNRPDLLDPAAMRAGRFEKKLFIGRPEKEAIGKFFEMYFKKVPLAEDLEKKEVVDFATSQYLSDEHCFYKLTLKKEGENDTYERKLGFLEIGSGAMIESIVEDAKKRAIDRDVQRAKADKVKDPKASGVSIKDIEDAIASLVIEQKRLNHSVVFEDLAKDFESENIDCLKVDKL
jgi:ATP-dependent 26S proteasome regulatory subunit